MPLATARSPSLHEIPALVALALCGSCASTYDTSSLTVTPGAGRQAQGEASGGEIRIQLPEAPTGGSVRLLLFDSADSFDGLRAAERIVVFPADGRELFVLSQVPPGEYAVLVHLDENDDGALDRNLIGIPVEPIAFSNGYRPLGPPSYSRARFELGAKEARTFDLELARPLGERGLFSDLADYDFGVTAGQALTGRPEYAPGDSLNWEVGLGASVEITRNWRLIVSLGVQFLDDDIRQSPIVDEDVLYQGFGALSYAF